MSDLSFWNFLIFLFLIVPFIIHFFSFRKSIKINFSNSSVLSKIIHREGNQSKVDYLLILSTRILLFLSIIFGSLFFNNLLSPSKQSPIILLDEHSFNSQMLGDDELLSSIISNTTPRGVNDWKDGNDPFVVLSLEQFRKSLRTSKPDDPEREVFILSNSFLHEEYDDIKSISSNIGLVPIRYDKVNVSIDSIFVETFAYGQSTLVSICFSTNYLSSGEFAFRLIVEDNLLASGTVMFKDESIKCVDLSIQGNLPVGRARVEIEDDAIGIDNDFYFTLKKRKKYKVMVVDGGCNDKLPPVFFNEDLFEVSYLSDYELRSTNIIGFDAFILNGINRASSVVQELIDSNNSLLFIPCKDGALGVELGANILISKVRESFVKPDSNDPFFKNIFLNLQENIEMPFAIQVISLKGNFKSVFSSFSGHTLIGESRTRNGLFLFTFPLNREFSNFQFSSFFLPFIYRAVSSGAFGGQSNVNYFFQDDDYYQIQVGNVNKGEILKLKLSNGEYLVPDQRWQGDNFIFNLDSEQDIKGFVSVHDNTGEGVEWLAFNSKRINPNLQNLENRLKQLVEANPNFEILNIEEFKQKISTSESDASFPLWKYCLILAFVLLLGEIFFLRRISTSKKLRSV